MAKLTGRGISAIEYPTGMNQNGDPSQAWIKIKPDGRVDVFSGTSDIGNGSKTIQSQIVAETLGVPYDWITYDNSNTDSSPVCTGTFASRATFVAGKAVEKAALSARQKLLEIASKELEIAPEDLEVIDGEVIAKGAPQKKIGVPDVAKAKRFYDAALKPLGYACLSEGEGSLGYGRDAVALWIGAAERPVPADEKSGLHLSLRRRRGKASMPSMPRR